MIELFTTAKWISFKRFVKINNSTSNLNFEQIKSGPTGRSGLDRERQDHFELRVLATDTPSGGSEQKSSATKVRFLIMFTINFCIPDPCFNFN